MKIMPTNAQKWTKPHQQRRIIVRSRSILSRLWLHTVTRWYVYRHNSSFFFSPHWWKGWPPAPLWAEVTAVCLCLTRTESRRYSTRSPYLLFIHYETIWLFIDPDAFRTVTEAGNECEYWLYMINKRRLPRSSLTRNATGILWILKLLVSPSCFNLQMQFIFTTICWWATLAFVAEGQQVTNSWKTGWFSLFSEQTTKGYNVPMNSVKYSVRPGPANLTEMQFILAPLFLKCV